MRNVRDHRFHVLHDISLTRYTEKEVHSAVLVQLMGEPHTTNGRVSITHHHLHSQGISFTPSLTASLAIFTDIPPDFTLDASVTICCLYSPGADGKGDGGGGWERGTGWVR